MNFNNELQHLKIQLGNYDEAANILLKQGYTPLTSVIGPILTVNSFSLQSMLLLAEKKYYRDLMILSRPFLEAVINIGFHCADETAVVKSKKYAYQKGYRDLFRDIDINGFNIKSTFAEYLSDFEKAMPQNLSDAISDYTTAKGKEINSWTSETTKEKLIIIGQCFGDYVNGLLTFAFFCLYRDMSEIIHNSYYGVRIYIGMQQKDELLFKDSEEAAEYFAQHQEKLSTLVLQQINISICSLINIFSQKFQLEDLKELYEKSNNDLLSYANNLKK